MYFVTQSVSNITNEPASSQQNENDNRDIINTRTQNSRRGYQSQSSTKQKFYHCTQNKTVRFSGICSLGIFSLIGGSTLLVLHFASTNRESYLIPALCMFILGIAVTSFGDWYCRSKLNRRQRNRRREYLRRHGRMTSESTDSCDSPPPYLSYADYTMQELPTVTEFYNSTAVFSDENNSNQGELNSFGSPPYDSISTGNFREQLPSYEDATIKITMENESVVK